MRSVGVAVVVALMALRTASQTEAAVACPQYRCGGPCGTIEGPNGCPAGCACNKTCENVTCSAGEECQLVTVTCLNDPCPPQPQCVPKKAPCPTPKFKCLFVCPFGAQTDANGCPICACKPAPSS